MSYRTNRRKGLKQQVSFEGLKMSTTDSMERAKTLFDLTPDDSMKVDLLKVNPHLPHAQMSFYEDFSTRGLRVLRVKPHLIVCSLKVPPRLIDRDGNLASGAIVGLVDEIGASLIYRQGLPMSVSVNMSVSYMAAAKVDDELEVTAKLMGKKGNIVDIHVIIAKDTGEIVAEGRHQLFCKHASKL